MSYQQEYQYSLPTEQYNNYSYSASQSQYTDPANPQAQYTPSDTFSSTPAQQQYQYDSSYAKPLTADAPTDYNNLYTSGGISVLDSNPDSQYTQGGYAITSSSYPVPPSYSAPTDSSFQTTPYQYPNPQVRHESPSTNEMGYQADTNYSSSYQYSVAQPDPMDPGMSNHSYGVSGGFATSTYSPGDSVQDGLQHTSSYANEYSGAVPTSHDFYDRQDNAGVGTYLGDSALSDPISSFGKEFSASTPEVFDSGNGYSSHGFEDGGQMPFSNPSYQPQELEQVGYGGPRYNDLADRKQSHHTNPRGGRNNNSSFSSNRGVSSYSYSRNGSSYNYGSSYNKTTPQHQPNNQRAQLGESVGDSFSGNRFSNSRSRGSGMQSWSQRSRGSSNFTRGSTGSQFNSSRGGNFGGQGSIRGNQQRGSFTKPLRDSNIINNSNKTVHLQKSFQSQNRIQPSDKTSQSQWKSRNQTTDGSKEKEKSKAPSRPQDRLLNEIEEKEKAEKREKERKAAEEKETAEMARKAAEDARKAEEEAKQKIMEEARKKTEEMAKKLAPPSKLPETPEEIAEEDEIQRKIRESVVVIDPVKELALLTEDPSKDIEMPDELRKILKTLISDTLCKLCSLRMVGPHMAPMHYNGKNHLKKVRTFVQTNGRSAGFNMETLAKSEESTSGENKGEEKAAEKEEVEEKEEEEVDETKYCKICKVHFPHGSQYEMHYKGKNHAKKVRSLANSTEIYECKLCCVTVVAQEHLTAHINGARHKLQLRKSNRDTMRGRGGFYSRPGRGGMGIGENGLWKANGANNGQQGHPGGAGRGRFDGRDRGRGRGDRKSASRQAEEELYDLLGLTPEKRFRFDIANFQTPSGSFYCCYCDITMDEEPHFLLHLGSRKHQNKIYSFDKKLNSNKVGKITKPIKIERVEGQTKPIKIERVEGQTKPIKIELVEGRAS